MIIKRVVNVFKAGGPLAVLSAVIRRVRMPHAHVFPLARELVAGRTGLEIGGPSPIFSPGGLLPVYRHAERVDNCNFAAKTIWEGEIAVSEVPTFVAGRRPGRQYVAEGGELSIFADASYDFVLSSHMIEHTANPIGTLREWSRILRAGGTLVLIVPHRDGTFDHRRPITTLEHLLADDAARMGEDDTTHLKEILALHDRSQDAGATDVDSFRARAMNNLALRSMHHHVFDMRLVSRVVSAAGFHLVGIEGVRPYHVFAVAVKPGSGSRAEITSASLSSACKASPFPTDQA